MGYLENVVDTQIEENRSIFIYDAPVVRDFPERQVEFWIDLIPGVVPIAKAPYSLVAHEMQ